MRVLRTNDPTTNEISIMAKIRSYAAAREAAAEINKEFLKRAQTAENPTGTPLADLQAELDQRLAREGGDHADFLRQSLRAFARDTHNHLVDADTAAANATRFIEAYTSEHESAPDDTAATEKSAARAAKA